MRFDIHNHTDTGSNIRLIDSKNKVEDLIDYAVEIGLAGIAISDHEALCVHPKALKHIQKVQEKNPDFKLGLFNEIYLVDERPCDEHYHYILGAKDAEGHKLLRILSSLAWMNVYNRKGLDRVDTLKSDLERYVKSNPGHLIASTACIGGELGKRILSLTAAEKVGNKPVAQQEHDAIVKFILWNKELFGDDFYIETQPGISKEQIIVNQRLVSIAQCFNIKVICSSDSHYLKKEDRYVHKSYLNSKTSSEREVDAFYADAYLHTDEEMIEKFKVSGFDELFVLKMFENTMEIYNKVQNYSLFHNQTIPKVEVKNYSIPVGGTEDYFNNNYPTLSSLFMSEDKIDRYWVNECINKLNEIDKNNELYLSRLEEEARVKKIIGEKLGTNIFAYPVTLQYYINKFWELGSIVGAGRGSSCSGLNHWLLGVTQINPIEYDFPFWRYLNEERAELPDIDLDLAPSKKGKILEYIKKERGAKFYDGIEDIFRQNLGAVLVATFGSETTKSAIQTACRGYRSEEYPDGIDVDTAQYLSSLIPSERGFLWDLDTVVNGDESKGRKPVTTFINEVEKYPGLLDIMQGVEGLISRRGSHASGVIFSDEDPFEFMAYMKTPSGEVITQYDLHDAEWCGATKYDFLVTAVCDKIIQTIKLLQENEEIESDLSLKEAYEKYLHPSNIDIENSETWKAIQNVKVLDLFQFDSQVGAQAAKKIKPTSIGELSDANGLMRLMTGEDGGEQPIDKYVRFKNNIGLWIEEMNRYGLTKDEQEYLKPHFLKSHGVPPSQEQLMTMLMDKNICGFSLKDANAARKIVGKKQMSKIPELHKQILDQATSPALGKYIWDCGVGPQMGYSFSVIHATAYSFIGYQTAYLATHWNPIYWNTACLIVNSETLDDNDYEVVNIYEKENTEDYVYEDLPDRAGKKKAKVSDYAKIATAIGAITKEGIKVSLININTSESTFKPDVKNNRILYGLKALSNINDEIVKKIIGGRPYAGLKDFMSRCPLTKTAMINLIKAGAFDEVDDVLKDRKMIMAYYISQVSEPKKRLTLQNFNGLIQHDLIPKELELQIRVYNFNKYLKTYKKVGQYYTFDDVCIQFYDKFLSNETDYLEVINGITCILQTTWDKIYKKYMETAKVWMKDNQETLLKEYNAVLFKEVWDKYANGTISKWEMDSLCFYSHPHELAEVNNAKYGFSNFSEIPNEEIDYFFKRGERNIPIYKLRRIAGTVVAKNDVRSSVSLLTIEGIVNVKMSKEQYSKFKRQISEIQPDGTKKVIEKGWMTKGTKLVFTGFRREDTFVVKTYANSETHQVYKIINVVNGNLELQHERFTSSNTLEEDDYE